jgi:hypothetical protein
MNWLLRVWYPLVVFKELSPFSLLDLRHTPSLEN